MLALRFTSELFIKWLEIYPKLEFSGYLAVALVGLKLLLSIAIKAIFIPDWITPLIIICLFIWGFSEKNEFTEIKK